MLTSLTISEEESERIVTLLYNKTWPKNRTLKDIINKNYAASVLQITGNDDPRDDPVPARSSIEKKRRRMEFRVS